MRDTIIKLQYIDTTSVQDFSFFPSGSKIALEQFINSNLLDIPILVGKSELDTSQVRDSKGISYDILLRCVISNQNSSYRNILDSISSKSIIAVATTSNGSKKIIGSKNFPAHLEFIEKSIDLSSSYFEITISCICKHGIYNVLVP